MEGGAARYIWMINKSQVFMGGRGDGDEGGLRVMIDLFVAMEKYIFIY